MFGRKKKNENADEAGVAGLPSMGVSAISSTPPQVSPVGADSPPAGESTPAPADGPIPPTAFRTTVRIEGPANVVDARNVPGLRDEILDVMSHGGNPAEIQDIVTKAMSQGHVVSGASPVTFGAVSPALPPADDPLDRLKKLNDLRLAGALTDAEFEAQKAKILGET